MSVMVASDYNNNQYSMNVPNFEMKVIQNQSSTAEKLLTCCIFKLFFNCNDRHRERAFVLANEEAKSCISSIQNCIDCPQRCIDKNIEESRAAKPQEMRR